jgi:diguanylate cyclase (GGDEF)-like protein
MLHKMGDRLRAAWAARRAREGETPAPSRPFEASTDPLTGLPTGEAFDRALLEAAHEADRTGGALNVLCIGVDGFELLNNTYGRSSGDLVLRLLAERLKAAGSAVRGVARLSGPEFLLATTGTVEQGREAARAVLQALSQPLVLDGQALRASCSVGLANYPAHGASTVLVAHAELAMRAARDNGGGCHAEYHARMTETQRERAELARDLRGAVERGELVLYYQPKVDARSQQITAAEALVRWQHPRRGLVTPDVFIPLAERHGLIAGIGDWVLGEATRQAAAWREAGLRMRVAINVSGVQLRQDDFDQQLEMHLSREGLRPSRFTCEITETVAMEDTLATQRAFASMARLGVHVSIDDFGTGHSSLALLRRLRAAELKIDRAFVTDLGRSADALAVVKAVVQLAHSLDMRVVAEGVEDTCQRDLLVQLGCDELQGFLFARPMTARALELWAMTDEDSPAPGFRPSLFSDTSIDQTFDA